MNQHDGCTWREELAWSAGLFDGEGHIGARTGDHSQGPWKRLDLYISISQVDRRVLDRFRDAVGVGSVNGPYLHPVIAARGNEQPRFYFQTQRFEHIQAVVAMLWPWLGEVKRQQAIGALTLVKARRGHQTTCRHGHEKTPENSYWSKGQRHCKPCRMAQWKKHRRLKVVGGTE